ncbi:MAG: hypothetical protein IJ656_01660 [Bacilli bacterium]|nr:hypothetical protein [Bacilli bacterium]
MKKQLSLASKRKWVTGGILAFSAVSLLTTGFATWVVGVQRTQQENGIAVQVDTASSQTAYLTVKFAEGTKLTIGETSAPATDTSKLVNVSANDAESPIQVNANAMKVSLDVFSVALGGDLVDDYDQVTFTLKSVKTEGQAATADTYAATADSLETLTNGGEELDSSSRTDMNYITFSKTVALTQDNFTIVDNETDKTFTANANAKLLEFEWGGFFGGVSPYNFYNGVFNSTVLGNATAEEIGNYTKAIKDELDAMKKYFETGEGAEIKIFAGLSHSI